MKTVVVLEGRYDDEAVKDKFGESVYQVVRVRDKFADGWLAKELMEESLN